MSQLVALHEKPYFLFPSVLKDGLSKNISLEYDLSCIKWDFFFTRKYDIISLDGKWKMIFLKKYMEIWYFLYTCINVTNMILLFCQKNQRRSSPEKIHLKVIDILDWHSRKSSNDSLYFYGDLYRRFHILRSSEKKQETSYIVLKFDFFFNLFGWRCSTMKNHQSSGIVFRGVLERQLRKLFVH